MAENSSIEWTDHTYNPWRGCAKVSEGCRNCYAERSSGRNPAVLGVWGPSGTRVMAAEAQWLKPLSWAARPAARRPRVFCASLADVFEDWPGQMTNSRGAALWASGDRPPAQWPCPQPQQPYTLDHARRRLWRLIRATPELDWLLLTKRPDNIARMMPHGDWPNVWLGASVEDDSVRVRADMLQDAAQSVRCPVRFVSAEPLIGPLDLSGVLDAGGVNWVIVGGESGAGGKARPFDYGWCLSILRQCGDAGVPCFVKQVGARPFYGLPPFDGVNTASAADPKGGDMGAWPVWMRVREFPEVSPAAAAAP